MISICIYKHSQQWQSIYIVEIVLINNLGFKVLLMNSGTMLSNMRKDINRIFYGCRFQEKYQSSHLMDT